jgi:hemoglobin
VGVYADIGGEEALASVVDDFYERVVADPELAAFFRGAGLSRLKGVQTEFFAAALGGPDEYRGRSMRDVHRGRGITRHHFGLVASHLRDALSAAGLPPATVDAVIGTIAPLADEIVTPGPAG